MMHTTYWLHLELVAKLMLTRYTFVEAPQTPIYSFAGHKCADQATYQFHNCNVGKMAVLCFSLDALAPPSFPAILYIAASHPKNT